MPETEPVSLRIPTSTDEHSEVLDLEVGVGEPTYILGANGTGKSALLQHLVTQLPNAKVERILAHRQTWLSSSSVELTPKSRRSVLAQTKARDRDPQVRWRDDHAPQRMSVALFDLVARENEFNRRVREALRAGRAVEAQEAAEELSPLELLNNLLLLGTLSAQVSVDKDGEFSAHHGNGPLFPIEQLSDGERNAVILSARVLTVDPGSYLLIDEPERHLHNAITVPLLSALFAQRRDCAFIVSTHESALPARAPGARTLLVRACSWEDAVPKGWDVDIVSGEAEVPGDVLESLLGSRRRIAFVEGTSGSLDTPFYAALSSNVSVIAKGGCIDVINAVDGVSGAKDVHWVEALGIIDGDDRTEEDVGDLAARGIYAIPHSSIESLFYSAVIVQAIAKRQSDLLGVDSERLVEEAKRKALDSLTEDDLERLSAKRCEGRVREQAVKQIPNWKTIRTGHTTSIQVDADGGYQEELERITRLVSNHDLDEIIRRYAIKETRVPSCIAAELRFQTRRDYEQAVVAAVKSTAELKREVLALLGDAAKIFPVDDGQKGLSAQRWIELGIE